MTFLPGTIKLNMPGCISFEPGGDSMQPLILLLTFVTPVLLVLALFRIITAERRDLDNRVKVFTTSLQHGDLGTRKKVTNNPQSLRALFQQASKVFAGKSLTRKMEEELSKADIPLRGEEFLLANCLGAALPGIFGIFVLGNLGSGLILGVFGLTIPRILVFRAKHRRIAKFNSQIGDALTVMSNSLRAGFSFLQTMEMISREMPPPLGDEFGRCLREMNLGTPTEQALINLNNRIESDDLDLVITAVLIQRQVGGNLAEVLDSISFTIRERIRIKGEIKTLTAQGRMSGIIIGLLPVVLGSVLYLINPEYIGILFKTTIGLALIGGGIVSQAIGIVLIKKVISIEV
jgi:tight adherence protein B